MVYLLHLSIIAQTLVVIAVFSGFSVVGLYEIRRLVPLSLLKENHDVAGYTFGVIGAFYGVVLAFVVVAAWQRFERTNNQVQNEALAIFNLHLISEGFPDPFRKSIQHELRVYALSVINNEWMAMAARNYVSDAKPVTRLWQAMLEYNPASVRDNAFVGKALDQLTRLSDARRLRYVYYKQSLPQVIWIVIYVGAVITIGFSYFFGLKYFKSQALMCATLASLIGLTILAITELVHPYQGNVRISSGAFRMVLAGLEAAPSNERQAALASEIARRGSVMKIFPDADFFDGLPRESGP